MAAYRNPAALLGLGVDPALSRLLRACGVDESRITGGASDYDKFLALAEALPLCEGHPLRESINAALEAATGISAPLCPHTARVLWNAWTDVHWYGREATPSALPVPCPHCSAAQPKTLRAEELVRLPDPAEVKADSLSAWGEGLEALLPADGRTALLILPADYAFSRPDPYHAGLILSKAAAGEALTSWERDLLYTQALRVWGLATVRRGEDEAPLILLYGGLPEAVEALLRYLNDARALPKTVWIPREVLHAGAVNGLYTRVGTGYHLTGCESSHSALARRSAYAAVAPLGRAVTLILPPT